MRRAVRDLGLLITNRDGQRTIKARNYAFLAAGALAPVIAVDVDGVRYYLSTADKEVSRIFYIYRYYERPMMTRVIELLSEHLGEQRPLRDKAFMDIGANIGTATVCALAHFDAGSAFCFEPAPDSFALLKQNLLANDLIDRARTFEAAVSDRAGEMELEFSHWNWGDHRVRMPGPITAERFHESSRRVTTVQAITLDALVAAGELDPERVGLVWIDTQGHEANVLTGATALLQSRAPVVMEYWPYGLRNAGGLDRLHALIEDHFMHFVDLTADRETGGARLRPASDVASLAVTYEERVTDLLLLSG